MNTYNASKQLLKYMNSFQNYDLFPLFLFYAYAIVCFSGQGDNVTILYYPTISDFSLKLLKQSGPVVKQPIMTTCIGMNHIAYIKHTA